MQNALHPCNHLTLQNKDYPASAAVDVQKPGPFAPSAAWSDAIAIASDSPIDLPTEESENIESPASMMEADAPEGSTTDLTPPEQVGVPENLEIILPTAAASSETESAETEGTPENTPAEEFPTQEDQSLPPDIQPTDWAFDAVRALVDRYDCLVDTQTVHFRVTNLSPALSLQLVYRLALVRF